MRRDLLLGHPFSNRCDMSLLDGLGQSRSPPTSHAAPLGPIEVMDGDAHAKYILRMLPPPLCRYYSILPILLALARQT